MERGEAGESSHVQADVISWRLRREAEIEDGGIRHCDWYVSSVYSLKPRYEKDIKGEFVGVVDSCRWYETWLG